MEKKNTFKSASLDALLIVLMLGSLWGLSEVFLSEIIKKSGLPLRAAILTGVGFMLLGISLVFFKKPKLFPVLAVIAIMIKQLAAPLTCVSFMCKANTCIAVFLQAAALTGAVSLIGSKNMKQKFSSGFSAGIASGVAFYFIGLCVAPCAYLTSFASFTGFFSFLGKEAFFWALFGGVLFPAGCLLGEKMKSAQLFNSGIKKPAFYFSTLSVIIISWVVSGIVILLGA